MQCSPDQLRLRPGGGDDGDDGDDDVRDDARSSPEFGRSEVN